MTNQDLKRLRKTIKQDKRYTRLIDVLEDTELQQYNIPFDDYIEEITTRFSARKFRRLDSASVDILTGITNASLEDANLRSRITEMLVVGEQAKKSIAALLDRFEQYVLMTYSSKMRTILTTQVERKAFVQAILSKFYSYLRETETFIAQLQLIVVDVDKANYAIKNVIEAQKLIYRPEMRSM